MKQTPTIGQVLGILSVLIIPLIVWGVSVETRLTEVFYYNKINEEFKNEIRNKLNKVDEKQDQNGFILTDILIELQNKENRKE